MKPANRLALGAALSLTALAAPLLATPADVVRTRIAGFRELGAAFKGVNDSLRGSEPQLVILRQYARQIRNASRQQYQWFPAGTGTEAGMRTSAKAEIWAKPNEFKAAQDAFARQAEVLERAARGTNAAAIRAEARKLGGTCKGCHDTFKVPQRD